jgi:RND family efflux transporter MFP subunit
MSEQSHAWLALPPQDPGLAPPQRAAAARRLQRCVLCLLLLLLAGAAGTLLVRHSQAKASAALAQLQSRQYVLTVRARTGGARQSLELPGSLQGETEAPIAARTSGYVTRLHADIGQRVKKGALLAEISSPEADQQLAQARAARVQTAAAVELAQVSLARWQNLRSAGAVSLQAIDERRSALAQAEATLAAVDANIERLKQLQAFKRIVAPFDGLITRRNVNVGDLIDAGAGRVLFVLTQTAPLRLYVYVPQAYSMQLQPDAAVMVTQAELPGQLFQGKIVRTAEAIDAASHSLQAEVSLPNLDGRLLPGAYVNATLALAPGDALTVPANTLLLRSEGPRIAVVDASGKVSLHPVTIGKDLGLTVQIASGIAASDELVLNPADSLAEGDMVVARAAPARVAGQAK